MKKILTYFTRLELAIWAFSVTVIVTSYLVFDRESYLTLLASLVGITAIMVSAKGNPIGQALMVVFSISYGAISYSFAYYGEMITYLGMSGPMALLALISWLRNPYKGKRSEVRVSKIGRVEMPLMWLGTVAVTVAFYLILRYFDTANLLPSTLSVATSFLAVYLTFRRSPYFALAYAVNDVVLIVLWVLASMEEIRYVSVVGCFLAFLANDLYCFISWLHMRRRQAQEA